MHLGKRLLTGGYNKCEFMEKVHVKKETDLYCSI
jgi:hypothetical protein